MAKTEKLKCDKCSCSLDKYDCWLVQGYDKNLCEDCNIDLDAQILIYRNMVIEEFFKEKIAEEDLEERLLLDAKQLEQEMGKLSIPLLQRKFKISELKARDLIFKLKLDTSLAV